MMSIVNDLALIAEIIQVARLCKTSNLCVGTSGNISARNETGFLITPSGLDYDKLQAKDVITMDMQGKILRGNLKPSSELPFHQGIYLARQEINAIIHVHSPYATSIACTRQDIPAFHYMVAVAGGNSIRCAEYACFGSTELSQNIVVALEDRYACILANHGMLATGIDVQSAFRLTQEVENLARQYWLSSQIGEPIILDDAEMRLNLEKFKNYGKQNI